MRRFVLKAAAFVLGLSVLCTLLQPLDSFPDIEIVGPKFAHVRQAGHRYNVLFFGSSYVHREFSPEVFDAEMHRLGFKTRSFNFGVPGMDPPETYFLAERALAAAGPDLEVVLIELDYFRTSVRERNLHSRRNDYWHDLYHTAQVVRATIEEESGLGFKAKTVARHAEAFARKFLQVGRGLAYVKSTSGRIPDVESVANALGPAGDGFTALDDQQTMATAIRADLFEAIEVDVYGEKLAALRAGTARPEKGARPPTRAGALALDRLVRTIRSRGARPVLVVPPCLDPRSELVDIARSRLDADVLTFNDPGRFPALYDVAHRFDVGHLNKAGAILFSTYLAQEAVSLLSTEEAASR